MRRCLDVRGTRGLPQVPRTAGLVINTAVVILCNFIAAKSILLFELESRSKAEQILSNCSQSPPLLFATGIGFITASRTGIQNAVVIPRNFMCLCLREALLLPTRHAGLSEKQKGQLRLPRDGSGASYAKRALEEIGARC